MSERDDVVIDCCGRGVVTIPRRYFVSLTDEGQRELIRRLSEKAVRRYWPGSSGVAKEG